MDLGYNQITPGDKIIINGTIGDHGMTIISQREGIKFESQLQSDCAGLAELTCNLLEASHFAKRSRMGFPKDTSGIKFMRDPTRGGLAATLNEISRAGKLSIEIRKTDIPVNPTQMKASSSRSSRRNLPMTA